MKIRSSFRSAFLSRTVISVYASAALLAAMTCGVAAAQTGQEGIHTIYVVPSSGAGTSTAELNHLLIERINQSGHLRVVSDEKAADAVLRASTVIWPVGMYSPNPKSKAAVVTDYQGYASADLADKAGQPLWSYLATPSRFHFSGIVSDLANQLDVNLLAAIRAGFATAPTGAGTAASPKTSLRIAGATFPAPLYRKWLESYAEHAGSAVNGYDAVGSTKGLSLLAEGKIDLAASDIPSAGGEQDMLRFPTVVGAVVPIVNLPTVKHGLNLTPEVLADIYSGKITRWNDEHIRKSNSGVTLPNALIEVVHRSDGSGTTYVWTSFLASMSADWKTRNAAAIEWPVGVGESGNEGVANQVASTKNSIGYVELTYAIQHELSYASVRNPAGHFIHADLRSISAAAQNAKAGAMGGSLLNEPGSDTYPIATFTYLLVRKQSEDAGKLAGVADVLRWMLTSGQKQCSSLGYAPLPKNVVDGELETLKSLRP